MRTGFINKCEQKLSLEITIESLERSIANGYLFLLSSYFCLPNTSCVQSHEIYIDSLLEIEDFLYFHGQDVSVIYLSLLDNAVSSLKRLSESEHIPDYREKLADYLEKAAVIFQTAADKTLLKPEQGRQIYQEIWRNKAQQYSQEAFQIRHQKDQDIPHEIRMQQLYQKFVELAEQEDSFAKNYLVRRCREYSAQCEADRNVVRTAASSSVDERLYVRHRQGFKFDSADELDSASTPLLPPIVP